MEPEGALVKYTKTLAGDRNPFTFTVPLIFPANARPGKYINNKKANNSTTTKYLRNCMSSTYYQTLLVIKISLTVQFLTCAKGLITGR
jgi:hypothetical protein